MITMPTVMWQLPQALFDLNWSQSIPFEEKAGHHEYLLRRPVVFEIMSP